MQFGEFLTLIIKSITNKLQLIMQKGETLKDS